MFKICEKTCDPVNSYNLFYENFKNYYLIKLFILMELIS